MWSEVNNINNSKVPLPTRIEDATGNENILKLWKNHFQNLFNCINNSNTMNKKMDVNCSYNTMKVTINDIQDAINKLDCNKSCGADDIYAEHLKYASEKIYPLLSILYWIFG